MAAMEAGSSWAISSAQAFEAMILASGRQQLPLQWSPLAWVFTSCSMCSAAGTEARMVRSMRSVRGRSYSVSTRSAPSPSVISPALDQPQLPSGWR